MTRTWLIDPQEVEAKASKAPKQKGSEPWNGRDFFVSIGEGPHRNWDDCRKYGFISGGGGKWYSQTLEHLFPGARVFATIPKLGYVGVGVVTGKSTPVNEFKVQVDGRETPILDAKLTASGLAENASPDAPEKWEYFVPVDWTKTVSREEAYWEKGVFSIQHTACKLRSKFTLERLTQHFELDD